MDLDRITDIERGHSFTSAERNVLDDHGRLGDVIGSVISYRWSLRNVPALIEVLTDNIVDTSCYLHSTVFQQHADPAKLTHRTHVVTYKKNGTSFGTAHVAHFAERFLLK